MRMFVHKTFHRDVLRLQFIDGNISDDGSSSRRRDLNCAGLEEERTLIKIIKISRYNLTAHEWQLITL